MYAKTARYDLILTAGEARTGFDVTMRLYASISGTITCERCDEADVAEGLYVEFERSVGTRSEPAWVHAGGVWAEATDEADGAAAYTFSTDNGLVPGTYRAQVGGTWGWRTRANLSPAVTVADGADVTLDLAAEFLQFDRDFSGDDHPDVIARTGAGALLMYSGDGAGGWSGVGTIGSGWSIMNHVFAAGDFSGDGHEDVMARDSAGRLHLYRGDALLAPHCGLRGRRRRSDRGHGSHAADLRFDLRHGVPRRLRQAGGGRPSASDGLSLL